MTEENIIIKGEVNRKRVLKRLLLCAAGLFVFAVLVGLCKYIKLEQINKAPASVFRHMTINSFSRENIFGLGYLIAVVIVIAALVIWYNLGKNELTVSDKRIWGKTDFGKKVDIPINQISSLSYGKLGSINFNTEKGSVKFWHISNKGMIYTAVSALKAGSKEKAV